MLLMTPLVEFCSRGDDIKLTPLTGASGVKSSVFPLGG